MQKRALVVVPTEAAAQAVIDTSVSLASARRISLDAIAMGYERTPVPLVDVGGLALTTEFGFEREEALARAQAALKSFGAAAAATGVTFSCRTLCALPVDAAGQIAELARFHDFIVAPQVDPGCDTFDKTLVEQLLLEAGRPILFVPYTAKGPIKFDRVGVCWDGGRAATRALHDAMPFLEAATSIAVITVNSGDVLQRDRPTKELTADFKGMGLNVRIIALNTETAQIQPTILSLTADEGFDLLVMGGYGHSRIKETFLGGVTREMLQSMTVPTLMSH